MWSTDWQNLVALVVVFLTIAYLVRREWRKLIGRKKAGCGACSECPASVAQTDYNLGSEESPASPPIVVGVGELLESGRRLRGLPRR